MTTRNDNGPQGYCGFEVGQHVVYLDGEPRNDDDPAITVPSKGVVYTVREVLPPNDYDEDCGLYLREILNPRLHHAEGFTEPEFSSSGFRPLPKLRVEDFLAASTPKDVVGRVPA